MNDSRDNKKKKKKLRKNPNPLFYVTLKHNNPCADRPTP